MTGAELCLLVKMTLALSTYQYNTACRHADYIVQQSEKRGLDPLVTASIIYRESAFSPRAVSHAGACGLMQVIPKYSRYTCEQLKRPRTGIRAGIQALHWWLSWAKGDISKALCGYNAGTRCIRRPGSKLVLRVHRTYVKGVLTVAERMRLNNDKLNRSSSQEN